VTDDDQGDHHRTAGPPERLDRAPLEHAEVVAKDIGRVLKSAMPEGWGFVLILSSYGPQGQRGQATYLSSIEREGSIFLLRETANDLEQAGGHEDAPRG
jgi:hypothetical protein